MIVVFVVFRDVTSEDPAFFNRVVFVFVVSCRQDDCCLGYFQGCHVGRPCLFQRRPV